MEVLSPKQANASGSGDCSKCGLFLPLATANRSRKTGEMLYRSWCTSCEKQRKAKWVQDNIEHVLTKTREYQAAHPEQVKTTKKKWADNNKEYQLQYRRSSRLKNPERFRAEVSARRARVKQQKPAWESFSRLRSFYENCPEGYHVDHILPLRGKLISGLHVLENLQYLPASENMAKHNKFNLEEYNAFNQ
jgi:hypothetical protein